MTPVVILQAQTNSSHLPAKVLLPRNDRCKAFERLSEQGLGVKVLYIPVHLPSHYRQHFDTAEGDCPVAEAYYAGAVTLPLFASMPDKDVAYVVKTVLDTVKGLGR